MLITICENTQCIYYLFMKCDVFRRNADYASSTYATTLQC